MAHEHTRAGRFQSYIGGLVLAAVVLSFATSELMRFTDGVLLAVGGFALAAAIFSFYQLAVRPTLDPKLRPIAWVLAVVGLVVLSFTFAGAIVTAEDFSVECAKQQARMMTPAGDNAGAAIFHALRCEYSA